jgi:hypothetical protein
MRECRKCGVAKPLTSFPTAPQCKDGRRSTCHRCRIGRPPVSPPSPPPRFARALDAKRYIITAAQNATPVHALFLETLRAAAKRLGAELVVIPLRYKNPTQPRRWSQWARDQGRTDREYFEADTWWDPAVEPYLYNARKKLCPNLVLVGDVKIQPTASSPLTGFESLTGAESCIIGHPKMQYRTISVPSGRFPKILTTTGACTERNYSDTRAGKVGEFHHFLGALIVEVEGKKFHLRQVNASREDGSFTDLDKHYTPGGVFDAPPALGLVLGDTHVRVTDPENDAAVFGPGGMVEVLDPQTLVFHDLFDGETVNPHEVGNPFIAEAKRRANRQDVEAEVREVVEFINARARARDAVIVDSNHHDFLARWVIRHDWRQDQKNARFYLETALAMLSSARMTPGGADFDNPFHYWVKRLGVESNVRCLAPDESFRLGDVECGMHGHNGPGGSRGSVKNLSRLGTKNVTGHGHSPAIEEGHYRVGTSTPRRLAYQRGPTSSLNTHCVVYATGRRALLTVVESSWRLV